MSGFELVDHLTMTVPPPPAIFITAQDAESQRERASRIPNSVYLSKPIPRTVLLEAVRSLLRLSRSCAENSRKAGPLTPDGIGQGSTGSPLVTGGGGFHCSFGNLQ
jgi:DNA-binding NarL/FixJ family response regulator